MICYELLVKYYAVAIDRGHSDAVDQLIWHPTDPDLLATASGDRTVRIWDYRSAKSVATVNTKGNNERNSLKMITMNACFPPGENINITWSPDGKTLAVGNKEDLISFIDVKTHKIIREEQFKVLKRKVLSFTTLQSFIKFQFEVNELAWNKEGDLFFLTNGQGCVHVYHYPEMELQHVLQVTLRISFYESQKN